MAGFVDAADANDGGTVSLSDAVLILSFLFLGGRDLPTPGPKECGTDPTPDELGACGYERCGGEGA